MLSVHTADFEFLLCPSGMYPINIRVQTCTLCMYVHCYYGEGIKAGTERNGTEPIGARAY